MLVWTKYRISLAVMLVITGTFNTLSMKWADKIKSIGKDGKLREFRHPFFQAIIMFFGEILCLVTFKLLMFYYKRRNVQDEKTLTKGNRNFNSWIFFLPAVCDVLSASTVYIGLTLTYASSFQMLRGSLIIFVAMLSIRFLNRRISATEWIGIFIVISGLLVVGASDFFIAEADNGGGRDVLIGDLFIVLAQVVTAIQIVLEEHFVSGKDVAPLQAVGLEGCFGIGVLGFLLIPLYYIHVGSPISSNPEGRLEDLKDAFAQIKNNLLLLLPLIGNAVSIAFFNFSGISVTKELSGTSRTVLDTVRTFFVWATSLCLSWQKFSELQILGFLILLVGIFVYNDILFPFLVRKAWERIRTRNERRGEEPLLNPTPNSEDPSP